MMKLLLHHHPIILPLVLIFLLLIVLVISVQLIQCLGPIVLADGRTSLAWSIPLHVGMIRR